MDDIRRLAGVSVWRGVGFACLAIATAMSGVIFDPALSFRLGAALMLALAVALEVKARTYHLKRRIEETEVWVMLAADRRPPKDQARRLIVAAMRSELSEKALYAAYVSGGFLMLSIALWAAARFQRALATLAERPSVQAAVGPDYDDRLAAFLRRRGGALSQMIESQDMAAAVSV